MKNIKLDKDLIKSIIIALLVSIVAIMILGILATMSWWLIYILLFSIFIPICYSIIKRYRKEPNSLYKFMIELFAPMYDYTNEDYEDEDENENRDNYTIE